MKRPFLWNAELKWAKKIVNIFRIRILPNFSRWGPNAYVHLSNINVCQIGANNTKIRFVDSLKTTESTPTLFHFEFVVPAVDMVKVD